MSNIFSLFKKNNKATVDDDKVYVSKSSVSTASEVIFAVNELNKALVSLINGEVTHKEAINICNKNNVGLLGISCAATTYIWTLNNGDFEKAVNKEVSEAISSAMNLNSAVQDFRDKKITWDEAVDIRIDNSDTFNGLAVAVQYYLNREQEKLLRGGLGS